LEQTHFWEFIVFGPQQAGEAGGLSALEVFKKNYKKMARKAGLMAQLRWITQRPWDYPLTPEAKGTFCGDLN
jgi:hypothetical protein